MRDSNRKCDNIYIIIKYETTGIICVFLLCHDDTRWKCGHPNNNVKQSC